LPWGVPTILSGCGFRNLSVPYLDYDCTLRDLEVPPVFRHEGPDGSRVRVALDRWASSRANYTQGAAILKDTAAIASQWLPHYVGLGDAYPWSVVLACGTHGDIQPHSGNQAREFAERIVSYNAEPGRAARLVNATYPQFWAALDQALATSATTATVRGSFGHAWDVWPVSLAKYAAASREGERSLLAAEAMLAIASTAERVVDDVAREELRRAEWCWAMLSDHAWNGTGEENQQHNAQLRRRWSEELQQLAQQLQHRAWSAAGVQPSDRHVTVFNSVSTPRRDLVRVPAGAQAARVVCRTQRLATQVVREDDRDWLYFVSPQVDGFAWDTWELTEASEVDRATDGRLITSTSTVESPYYRVSVDRATGGVASLVHKASGRELVTPGQSRTLCQTVFDDGREHSMSDVTSRCVADGPVLARLEIQGTIGQIRVVTWVTLYAELDRVDFDVRIHKPASSQPQRLCQLFPLLGQESMPRIATAGAVTRARRQPAGDLLPGADVRRFAVQEFVDLSDDALHVTLVPRDAFCWRMDLDAPAFEAVGNDQNHKEVKKDQDGVTDFRFRYSLIAHASPYGGADAVAFATSVHVPLVWTLGCLPEIAGPPWSVSVDPRRAVATCLKPADDPAAGGVVLRLWETAGETAPLTVRVVGVRRAILTDLLERDQREIPIDSQEIVLPLPPHGYGAVRLQF
jgi:hypothetical protein